MSEQELDLLQLSSRKVAELCARAPQIVWSETSEAGFCGVQLDDVPDDTFRHAVTQAFTRSADATKYLARIQVSCMDPLIHGRYSPIPVQEPFECGRLCQRDRLWPNALLAAVSA
jgi:hypothetical protein